MTEIILAFVTTWAIPFVVVAPTAIHLTDSTWLERELERRMEEAEEDDAANDNEWSPS